MNRMVEEERIEIGTLKSLGFSNKEIMLKYLLFSGVATFFGGLLGGIVGVLFIPTIISNIYALLYNVPNFYAGLNIGKIISVVKPTGISHFTDRTAGFIF